MQLIALVPLVTSLIHARYMLGYSQGSKLRRDLAGKSAADSPFMLALNTLRIELLANKELKDYIEQEGVSAEHAKHIGLENPVFNEVTV